jgi:hypothetical protein
MVIHRSLLAWATLIALSVSLRQLPASAADLLVNASQNQKAQSQSQVITKQHLASLDTANIQTESFGSPSFNPQDMPQGDEVSPADEGTQDSPALQDLNVPVPGELGSVDVRIAPSSPEEWVILRDDMPPMQLRVTTNTQGHASLIVNDAEVVRIRSSLDHQSPRERAIHMAETLYSQLSLGNSPQDIQEASVSGQNLIRFGDTPLLTVDDMTASSAGMACPVLAHAWTTQLRKALGAGALTKITTGGNSNNLLSSTLSIPQTVGKFLASGMASWYGPGFHGRRSANGSRFNMYDLTAAHRSLPFGSRVRVTNRKNGRSVVVKITDRGPYAHGRLIDLSKAAAQAIGMLGSGTAPVALELVTKTN